MTTTTNTPVVVYGPNIGHGGEFHVHAPGCADIVRGRMRDQYAAERPMAFDAASQQDVVEAVYADIMAEGDADWTAYASEFSFFPCCKLRERTTG